MKTLWLLFLFFVQQSESLQRYTDLFNKNWEQQTWDRDETIIPRSMIMRPKPQRRRNLFALKAKGQRDAALDTGIKVQGIARLIKEKLKLDLTMQVPNKARLRDPSATSAPVSTPTSAFGASSTVGSTTGPTLAPGVTSTGSPVTTGTPSSSTAASIGATTMVPATSTSGPTTSAVTSGPTSEAAGATTTASIMTVGPTSPPSAASLPTSGVTTMATSMASTTLGPTSTEVVPQTSAQPTTPVVTSASTAIPSPPQIQLPGAPTKPTCESPLNVNIIILAKEVLKSHNAYRRTHASPKLQLDDQMICDAQHFAQEIARRGVLKHQSTEILAKKRLGENIGMSCTPLRNGPLRYGRIVQMAKNVARRWYDEVCQYNFDKPNVLPRTGHFTEIVWSGSRKLGVGYAVGKNARFPGYQCVYVVGRYKPTGNIIGGQRLQKNVKRGSFNDEYCEKRSRDTWDKRNHLKYRESETARYHSKHHVFSREM